MVGRTLSHHRILEPLGTGGMGEVYLAEDTTLSRHVALKTLPAALGERGLHRFQHEARALAALDHPNIVHVYSVEESEGVHFITMQLVRGKTLARLLPARGFALDIFFDIAIPLADAIAAAHQAGILHRDLKPSNIMVGDDGHVTVLDFGLAKSMAPTIGEAQGAANEPTLTATAGELIVGTVAFMSPEQAEGKPIDARSDIFSLGIVLYEMLTGQHPFHADSTAGTLAAIISNEPPGVRRLNPSVPRELERLIGRCLAKPVTRRIQTALDVRNELEYLKGEPTVAAAAAETSPVRAFSRRSRWLAAGLGGLALAVAASIFLLRTTPTAGPTQLRLDRAVQLTTAVGVESRPEWSPDGTRVAFETTVGTKVASDMSVANSDIWVAQIGGGGINLTESYPGPDRFPSWSPDGTQIAFVSTRDGGGVFSVPALGGSPRRLFFQPPEAANKNAISAGGAPQWSADGSRIAVPFHTYYDGTVVVTLTLADQHTDVLKISQRCFDMSLSPDGRFIACVEGNPTWEVRRLWVQPSSGGDPVFFAGDAAYNASPFWSADGRQLYFASNRGGAMDLWRQSIDASGTPVGAAVRATTGLEPLQARLSPKGDKLVYSRGRPIANVWRVPILSERAAVWADAQQITTERAETRNLDVSPDGTELVVSSDRSGSWDLWRLPAAGGQWTQLTADAIADRAPKFSSDGTQIVFHSFHDGSQDIRIMPARGGPARYLAVSPATDWFASWSPDDKSVAFISDRAGSNDIWMVAADGTGEPRRLTTDPAKDEWPIWGLDGRHVIFESSRTNPPKLFQVSIEDGALRQLTEGAAWVPAWGKDGKMLFFLGTADRSPNIWGLSWADRREFKLTDLVGRAGSMIGSTLATDGRYLYFVWNDDESDIWVADVVRP